MCRAMNRSLTNVLFGAFGAVAAGGSTRSAEGLTVRSVSAEDAAIQLAYAQQVVVIPGGFPQALDQLFQFRFPTYGFGLTLQLPLRNRRAARSGCCLAVVRGRVVTGRGVQHPEQGGRRRSVPHRLI